MDNNQQKYIETSLPVVHDNQEVHKNQPMPRASIPPRYQTQLQITKYSKKSYDPKPKLYMFTKKVPKVAKCKIPLESIDGSNDPPGTQKPKVDQSRHLEFPWKQISGCIEISKDVFDIKCDEIPHQNLNALTPSREFKGL